MRRFLIICAIVLGLALAVSGGLAYWLSGAQLRKIAEAQLSATLGQPVAIGRLDLSLFPRPAVSGADIRVGETQTRAPALAIGSVRILPRLRPLLRRQVLIREIELDGFEVSILRDEHGGWHVPSAVPAPTADRSGPVIERVRVRTGRVRVFDRSAAGAIVESASIDDVAADVIAEPGGLRLEPVTARIATAAIGGSARTDPGGVRLQFTAAAIVDDDLPMFIRLLGSERPSFLRLDAPASATVTAHVQRASSRLTGTGTLQAPAVTLGALQLQRFEAPFEMSGSRLQFNPTTFALFGGSHRGVVTVDAAVDRSLWTTDSRLADVRVGDFLRALSGQDGRIDGSAVVTAQLRGRIGEPLVRSVRGRMGLTITNGVVREFPLLASVNRALRLAAQEGRDTRFEKLSATLAVADGQATTEDLVLEAGHVRVQAAGRIGADRSIDLRGVALVSAERAAGAVASVREFARLRNARGEFEVPLTMTGTLDAPSFAVDVGAALREGVADEIRRRIRRFIR